MKIISIKPAGCDNILRWAVQSNADLKNDVAIQSLINDQLFYHVIYEDVTFLELFRLTQTYRDKVRILDEKPAAVPAMNELNELFPGSTSTPEGDDVKFADLAQASIDQFYNLALQMKSDDDIIRSETIRLFLPMICRKFTVQLPFSFIDLINALPNDEVRKLFNNDYPSNIDDVLLEGDDKSALHMLQIMFLRSVSIVNYDAHYDTLLKVTKFSALRNVETNRLYKFRMIGFYKYDNINRSEVRCDMFKPDKSGMNAAMRHMARLRTGLKIEFAVQLPLQYMQMVENFFGPDDLKISYESSMNGILDEGLSFNDFITQEFNDDETMIQEYNNSIEGYRARIAECNKLTRDTLLVINNIENDVDPTTAHAILPSIYTTKAVFTIDMDYADVYINHYDALLVDMFQQMLDIGVQITQDINRVK